jgi:thiamine kinase-like enzyme
LPASLGHGDLSLANMVATERDGIWVVDWERAGPMPVLWDWRKLFEQVGLAREAYARFVRRHGGGEMTPADALPLAEQWRIVAVARVAEIVESLEAGGRLRSRHAHQRLARAAAAAATAVAGDGVAP